MNLTEGQCLLRVDEARVLRLATVDGNGRPHVVPATFGRTEEGIVIAVDSKPKQHRDLQRLRNIRSNSAVSVLVDAYDDDWTRLWWVRGDGVARIVAVTDEPWWLEVLAARYSQYREALPDGPLVVIDVHKWTGWSFSG